MDLKTYLDYHNLTLLKMANDLGLDESFISKLKNKKIIPSLPVALLISRYTNNEVSVVELISQDRFDSILEKKGLRPFPLKVLLDHNTTSIKSILHVNTKL